MADEQLSIIIRSTGGEQVVAQFKAVSTGAQQMGTTTEAAAKKAGASLKDMGNDSETLNRRMAAMGAAITTGAAILGQWSRSAQDAAAIQRQLEASIVATGESFETYAAQIEEVGARAVQLGQDDEAAAQAISALTQITGSASVAINEMGLVFDLAAAKGMSLESAAELVGKVHEGNTSILQRYGIVVREGATAEEALAAIQQQVAGQAEAHATTYARLREELANVTDAIGGAVGGFAPMLALLPGVSSGFTLAGSAIGALAPNLTKAAVASKALSLAMGPLGIAVAATAAAIAVYKIVDALDTSYDETVQEATKHTDELTVAIQQLIATGSPAGTSGNAALNQMASIGAQLKLLDEQIAATQAAIDAAGDDQQPAMHGDETAQQRLIAAQKEQLALLQQTRNAYGSEQEAIEAFGNAQAALQVIYTDTGIGAQDLRRDTDALFATFGRDHNIKALFDGLVALSGQLVAYDLAAARAAASTSKYWQVFSKLVSVGEDWTNLEVVTFLEAVTRTTDAAAFSLGNMAKQASAGSDAMTDLSALKYESIYQTQMLTAANDDNANSLNNLFQASLDTGQAMTAQAQAQKEAAAASLAWRVEATEGASTLGTLAAQASAGDDAMGGLTGSIQDVTTASQRMALGIGTANDALATFKGIQDGIIANGDVYNQQFSEYGQQISNIERAQKILNDRRAEGQQLEKDELAFLNDAPAALERLTGGQEDAAIAQGKLSVQYGENMSTGDRLNETLNGTNSAVTGLTGAVTALVLALAGLPGTTGTAVTLTGALEGYDQTVALHDELDALDGTAVGADVFVGMSGLSGGDIDAIGDALARIDGTVATATVNVLSGNTSGLTAGNVFGMHGGVLGYANGGMTQAVLAEAGYEHLRFANGGQAFAMNPGLYSVPIGTMVTPHPETAARLHQQGGSSIVINLNGDIHGTGDLDEFLAEAERIVRARFAGLGV